MSSILRPNPAELQVVFDMFNTLHPVGKRIEIYLQKNLYKCEVKRNEFLVKSGEVCDSIYFIKKGVLRGFITEQSRQKW